MDFYYVKKLTVNSGPNKGSIVVKPSFKYGLIKDLICKNGNLIAFWHDNQWHNDINQLIGIIDSEVEKKVKEITKVTSNEVDVIPKYIYDNDSHMMKDLLDYLKQVVTREDIVFNKTIFFAKDSPKREDYSTFKLNYTPKKGSCPSFYKLIDYLYTPTERDKIMWFMGALLDNRMNDIQKFMYLYGGPGTGKGTVIKIFELLMQEYVGSIDLRLLTSNDPFATSQVKEIPLLIDTDSNMARIKDDTNLLKLTSHESIRVNRKYSKPFDVTFPGMLITASNVRYSVDRISSGINRRAIVVEPTGLKLDNDTYNNLMRQIAFEVPYIASEAISHFRKTGHKYYNDYINVDMLAARVGVFDFLKENEIAIKDEMSFATISTMYKEYLEDNGFDINGYKKALKETLLNDRYFDECIPSKRIGGELRRNVLVGWHPELLHPNGKAGNPTLDLKLIELGEHPSKFDEVAKDYRAQYTTDAGTPRYKWDKVTTKLSDIDTHKLHYVQVPSNHIVLDFDLKDDAGEKSLDLNLEAASKYLPTYTEVSKSGKGVHLHYIYDGDVSVLANEIEPNIEIKVYSGKSSLRRKLTLCNEEEIKVISTGLPFKEEKTVNAEQEDIVWTEKNMRTAIEKNIRKEYHSATKPSIDFIADIFKRAEQSGAKYDLRDMRQDVLVFAMGSTHNASYCLDVVNRINFCTIEEEKDIPVDSTRGIIPDEELYFYDVEVFPNLLLVVYKKHGKENECVTWFNPTPEQIGSLLEKPLVGFNNRKYDNHILYARLLGKSNLEIFHISQSIVENKSGTFKNAYELSYADIFDYSSQKQSLKKWEIEMNITHDESEFAWDQELAQENWDRCAEYCMHDVEATEALFDYTYEDYVARQILSELSGLPINATTRQHAQRFMFGNDPRPQDKLIYSDLSKEFPGYKYEYGKSSYRGEDPGEGGYVYSEPGVYEDIAVLDIASMHPHTAVALKYFGPYAQKYEDLIATRIYVKHGEYDRAAGMFDGILKPYLKDNAQASKLAYALKIIINIVYGLSSAKWDNAFRHPKNVDNIIAKRGALFMINLKHEVQEKGFTVAHIKTDSIKIPNATDEIIKFVQDYGKQYGYTFEHEHTYKRMALVNRAVLIAEYYNDKLGKDVWEAVGAEFAEPFVYKTLFSRETITVEDLAITKQATAPIYINDRFIGKICSVYASLTGGEMTRRGTKIDPVTGDQVEKISAITKTKGYKWTLMSEFKGKEDVDMDYYNTLVYDALDSINSVGSVMEFLGGDIPDPYIDKYLPF